MADHTGASARASAHLAAHVDGVDARHRDVLRGEELLDGVADLDLGGPRRAAERVASDGHGAVRLLAHHRSEDRLLGGAADAHDHASSTCSRASRVMSTVSAVSRSRTERLAARITLTSGRLRALRSNGSLWEPRTMSTGAPAS